MRAGALNKRVSIQAPTEVPNDFGEPDVAWSTEITDFASIKSLTGREFFASQEIQAAATHEIIMRFVIGVTPKKRILYGSRIFDILYVDIDTDKDVQLSIKVKELV